MKLLLILCEVTALASVHAFVNVDLNRRATFSTKQINSQKSQDEIFQEREQAILEAGGDPFFLQDDEEVEEVIEKEDEVSLPSPTLMGMSAMAGGAVNKIISGQDENKIEEEKTDPGWEWDGEYDEDAYFD